MKKNIIMIVLSGLLMLSMPGCWFFERSENSGIVQSSTTSQQNADDYLEEAAKYLNEGNQDEALLAFAAAIEENRRLTRAHMGMGDIYRDRGDYEFAEQAYSKAVESNPRSFDANYFWGMMLQKLNRISEAIRAYRQALNINPDSHEANLNIATAYLQLDQAVEAHPFGKRAAEIQPEHGPTHANLGVIYAAMGQHDKAIIEYQTAMELINPSPELVLNLVESLRKLNRYAEMTNALKALIRMQPSPAAYERLGFSHFKLRQYEESIAGYRAALNIDAEYFPAMNGLGVNLLNKFIRSNRTDLAAQTEAIELLRRSIQLEQDQPRIIDLLSRYGR